MTTFDDTQEDLRLAQYKSFFDMLQEVAKKFTWKEERGGAIRGYSAEHAIPFCPITAVYLELTGKVARSSRVHDLTQDLGIGLIATDLVDAIDSDKGDWVSKRLRKVLLNVFDGTEEQPAKRQRKQR